MTSIEELQLLLKLIKEEKDEEGRQLQEVRKNFSLEERRALGVCMHPVLIDQYEYAPFGGMYIKIKPTTEESGNKRFQVGQSVYLEVADGSSKAVVNGVVSKSSKFALTFLSHVEELDDEFLKGKCTLHLGQDDTTYQAMERAIEETISSKRNRLAELREKILGYQSVESLKNKGEFLALPKLNDSQNLAIQKALASIDFFLIHGPPGTGKTTTLVELIHLIIKNEKQILVVAGTNQAVDLLATKINNKGLRTLRLGHPARISDDLIQISLDAQIMQHSSYSDLKKLKFSAKELMKEAHKYKRNYVPGERKQLFAELRNLRKDVRSLEQYISKDIVDQAQAIVCTPVLTTHELLKGKTFSTVVIDEAAQLLEPAAWLAIQNCNRLILAGDHCQLPPTVISNKAAKEGLEISLFEKIMDRHGNSKEEISQILKVQYRMHEEIMSFSNQYFYDGELKADDSVKDGTLTVVGDDSFRAPIEFIDIAGCGFDEEVNEQTKSTYNVGEANILVKHFNHLLKQIDFSKLNDALSIGFITPYKEQVGILEEEIKNIELKNEIENSITMKIHTVDGFQGQECDIIYISLVRSNDRGEIGFLSDLRRMNVAMTRAKKKLVVVGDSATIGSHSFYSSFIDYINSLNAYKSAWEYMMD